MESILLIGVPTGILWGIIARMRKKSAGGIILSVIAGAALWIGFVFAINMIMPRNFERSMLRQMKDAAFSFKYIFLPAGLLSIGLGLIMIPKTGATPVKSADNPEEQPQNDQ
jgi:hypothetical protein